MSNNHVKSDMPCLTKYLVITNLALSQPSPVLKLNILITLPLTPDLLANFISITFKIHPELTTYNNSTALSYYHLSKGYYY